MRLGKRQGRSPNLVLDGLRGGGGAVSPHPSAPAGSMPVSDGLEVAFSVGRAPWTDRRVSRKNVLAKLDPKGDGVSDMKPVFRDGDDIVYVGFRADAAYVEECRDRGLKSLFPIQSLLLAASAKSCPEGVCVAVHVFPGHSVFTVAADGVPIHSRTVTGVSDSTCLFDDGSMNEDGIRNLAVEVKRTVTSKIEGGDVSVIMVSGRTFAAKGARSALLNMTTATEVLETDLEAVIGDPGLLDILNTRSDKFVGKILTAVSWAMYATAAASLVFLLAFTYIAAGKAKESMLTAEEESLRSSLPTKRQYDKAMTEAKYANRRITDVTGAYLPVVFVGGLSEAGLPDDVRVVEAVSTDEGMTISGYVDTKPEFREMVLAETVVRLRESAAFDTVSIEEKRNRKSQGGKDVLYFRILASKGDDR